MKILSIIPARGGSKGIKLKNLVKLNQKPLLYYTVRASLNSKMINKTIVSTDNSTIAKNAVKFGAEVISRPKKLALDSTPLEPVIEHVLDYLQKNQDYKPDVIVILQNTSPLRTSNHIDESLLQMKKNNFDSILSGFTIHTFLWKKNGKTIVPVDYDPKKRPNRQQMNDQLFENGAIFATKTKNFVKSRCRISGKIGFYNMSLENSYNVDSQDDLKLIRKFFKNDSISK